MSSPLLMKKARASLKSSISDFLDIEDFSSNGKAGSQISFDNPQVMNDFIEELGDKTTNSPVDLKEEFTENTCQRIEAMMTKFNFEPEEKHSSKSRIIRRMPTHIYNCPESFKPSKYFQKLAVHESDSLILFNLERQIEIVPFGYSEARYDPFGTKSFISSLTFGNGNLKDITFYGEFNSKLNLRHIESKSPSRSWNLPKDGTSSHLKAKGTLVYCGLTNGTVVLYDLRMKAPIAKLEESIDTSAMNIFDPITTLEVWDEYKLLTASSKTVSIWDMRSNKSVARIEEKNKIPRACLLDEKSATVGYYSDSIYTIHSFEKNQNLEIKMESPIEDILYIPKLHEILILTTSPPSSENFVKSQVHIYSTDKEMPYYLDRLDMTEEYSNIMFSENENKLFAVGKSFFIYLNVRKQAFFNLELLF